MSDVLNQAQMTTGDFQRLLKIALSDLQIRRTLLENQIAHLQEEPRTLEQEGQIETLDSQIQTIAQEFRHYQQFVDQTIAKDIDI